MARLLRLTGDSFLLLHNNVVRRTQYWSDNHDGSGTNHLGMLLMMLRDELTGHSSWTTFMTEVCQIEPRSGHISPHDLNDRELWQSIVYDAASAIRSRCESLARVANVPEAIQTHPTPGGGAGSTSIAGSGGRR
jgi:hypothetical protein